MNLVQSTAGSEADLIARAMESQLSPCCTVYKVPVQVLVAVTVVDDMGVVTVLVGTVYG